MPFKQRLLYLLTCGLLLLVYLVVRSIFGRIYSDDGRISRVTKKTIKCGAATLGIMDGGDLKLRLGEEHTSLQIYMGYFVPDAFVVAQERDNSVHFVWKDALHLDFTYEALEHGQRYNISWTVKSREITKIKDAVSLKGAHWYGGTTIETLYWPIERWDFGPTPYVTGDLMKGFYGNVQERYWLSSAGIAIYVDYEVPLFLEFDSKNKLMKLIAKYEYPYYNQEVRLTYSIYKAKDIMAVHEMASRHVFSKPRDIPDTKVFQYPIWTSWAVYKWYISQDKMIDYATKIKQYGFKASQLEIDDMWSVHYGDFVFNSYKFPDPASMIEALAELDMNVTLWIPPFCDLLSASKKEDVWMKGSVTDWLLWWDGIGKLLDVSKPEAVNWFKMQLRTLRDKYKFHSYKFDAGEANWVPRHVKYSSPLSSPNEYTRLYNEIAADVDSDNKALEVRAATRTQHLPMFVRLMDKSSAWGYKNGLKTVIPHILQLGLIGYPFVIPDIIGGNVYYLDTLDKELYIRWLQASVFMPVLQFSVPPWNFDEEAINITRAMINLHEEYSSLIIELAHNATRTGHPIIRPLWWCAPRDEVAMTIDSEFLLGDDLLVAPVLERGARSRHIYLPQGTWVRHSVEYIGPGWLKEYPVRLDEVAYFHRLS